MSFFDQNNVQYFKEEYFFLSNFYMCPVTYKGVEYPSSEHAYISAKFEDPILKEQILNESKAGRAKRLGKKFEKEGYLRSDWYQVNLSIMEEILRDKFSDPTLRDLLLQTDGKHLYEGNWWHDNFYGHCICEKCETKKKNNNLGKLLMKIRSELKYISII